MILKNHTTIDKLMLDTAKDRAELIEYVTKNMERNLVEAMIDKIEPGKEYLIKLHDADCYEDFSRGICGYKMALEVDGWTPCSEKMPDYGAFVLVSGEFEGETKILITSGGHVRHWGNKFPGLAWMPLPEPYKEK